MATNAAGFAIVRHDDGDVRKGKSRTRPKWTAVEDEVLYFCVHRRLSGGVSLDGDSIFDEIIQTHPTWQRSVLAIKTRVLEHATTIRAQMLLAAKAESRKAKRDSDQAMLILEQSYQCALIAAGEANAVLREENAEFLRDLEAAKLDLTAERDKIVDLADTLTKAEGEVFDAGRIVQELQAENLKLTSRTAKMNLVAQLLANPTALDCISLDSISLVTNSLSIANLEDSPAGEKGGDDIPPLPQAKVQVPFPFLEVPKADET